MSAFAPWQQRIYDQAAAAIDAGRLGHGLLLCGPAQLGKRAVAERLARRLLCIARGADGEPCGSCRGCHLFASGTHPDYQCVSFIPNKEGTKLRTEIVIEQVRRLSEQLVLTPQYGGAQVAIIDPGEAINHAASNALLKTLEEPVPGRYLWLISAHPARLSATIRSRCQRLEFRLPPRPEALAWLRGNGHTAAVAEEALDAARGHPGLAHEWLQGNGLALRREVSGDLDRLARPDASVVEVAQRWAGDEYAELRLRHAADLALAQAAADLTAPARARSLAAWFDQANRVRDLLRSTVRADLAMVELLMAWRAAHGRHATRG
ncbi:DNA polymerase III subunit delta' [Montanilutibacter psychrotolerans]|uniref:DNA-directed DNA polymerase n=1 Tax=Montanilutibacter psychrotolerans TaxID=1327343 RepID=A0A3M8SVW3_9GAMM|nr:DNA polymerase III subunit delta' [Lysobacter psychrotolerans]RNF84963.1 DNA polymerase III subunit delta' [Lysobacter psychrotolerans]